jgi:hypothetical protein
MSNTKGWGLTARLINKHFGNLGDTIAQAIAAFDPETATEADRDRLQDNLMKAAVKLAEAKTAYQKEARDVESLASLIEKDTQVAIALGEKLASGEIDEATVNLLCDELESNKARLPIEEQERADAKAFLDEVQSIVDTMTEQLREFDRHAKTAKLALDRARAQKDLQEMRQERIQETQGLRGLAGQSTALSALTKRAQKIQAEADGLKTVADINQKPLDDAKKLDALRASVTKPAVESAADRLKRLAVKP